MKLGWREKKNQTVVVSSILYAGLFVYFYYFFFGHLQFLEQYQLMIYTPEYIGDMFSRPGGLSDFIGRFFTQFCYARLTGALAIALLLTINFLSTLYTTQRLTGRESCATLLMPACMIVFLMNEYAQVSFIAAITLAEALYLFLTLAKKSSWYYALLILFSGIGYWLIGPADILFITLAITELLFIRKYNNRFIFSAIAIAVHFGAAVTAYRLLPYRLHTMLTGVDYLRYSAETPLIMWIIYLIPFVACTHAIYRKRLKITWQWDWLIGIAVSSCIVTILHRESSTSEQFKQMDYWVRCGKWDKVIRIGEKEGPRSQLALVYLNLALGMEGQLTNRYPQFPQLGTRGLLNDWKRDCISALPLAEVMYRVGNMNTALRYSMEAMEANSDMEKSGRALERMAEINLINRDYAVARKYYMILRQSIFYRDKAEKMLAMIKKPELIDQHPEYGYMRKVRYNEDFIFNKYKFHPEEALKHLAMQNPENRLARDYYIVWQEMARNENRVFADDEQVR